MAAVTPTCAAAVCPTVKDTEPGAAVVLVETVAAEELDVAE
jgi:hypothetical protein